MFLKRKYLTCSQDDITGRQWEITIFLTNPNFSWMDSGRIAEIGGDLRMVRKMTVVSMNTCATTGTCRF
jgi:hypothetical protein